MSNVLFSLQNSAATISGIFSVLLYHPVTWGFVIGFLASTLIHLAILMMENPRHLPAMLLKTAPDSFLHLTPRNEEGDFTVGYTTFQKEYFRVRIAFYSVILMFLVVVVIALVRY